MELIELVTLADMNHKLLYKPISQSNATGQMT